MPQSGATAYTGSRTPYQATIVGIGAYKGTASNKVAYGISSGDLATCSVVVASKKFNWSNQPPTKDMITVNDAAGNPVDPSNWQFSAEGDSNGRFINYKNGGYTVTITPAPGSNLYTGSVTGAYTINKVDIVPTGTLPSFIAYEHARTGSPSEPFSGTYLDLYEGVDYTVSYSNNVEVGTASYTINGLGAYAGSSQSGTFKIMNAGDMPNRAGSATHVTDVSGAHVEVSNTSANYTAQQSTRMSS